MYVPNLKPVLPVVLLLLAACDENLSPEQTTDKFWSAIKNDNGAVLTAIVTSNTSSAELDKRPAGIASWQTGKIIIDNDRSSVDTEITMQDDTGSAVKVQTLLEAEQGVWKVNYAATVKQLQRQNEIDEVFEQLDLLSEKMAEEMNRSVEQFEQALPVIEQELSRIEDQVQEKIPEIKQRIEEFTKRLEEALKRRKQPEPTNEPIEI